MAPLRRFRNYDPFLAPQRWLLRLGSRFYYPIAAVAVMAVVGIVVRDALLGHDRARRLVDLMLVGGACVFVLYWRAERMWLKGRVNWLVSITRPERAFLWSGLAVIFIALGTIALLRLAPTSTAANHLWPLFLFPLLFLAERGDTFPFLFVTGLSALLALLLRSAVSNTFSGVLTPPLWLVILATSNYYLARRHLLLELRTALLREIANRLSNTPDIETSFEALAELIGHRLRHDHVRIWVVDESNTELVLHAAHGAPKAQWANLRLPIADGIPGQVIRERRPEHWDDASKCSYHVTQPAFEWVRAVLAVPILVAGQAVGVLEILSPREAEFWELDEEHLSLMADSIGIALARSQHVRREAERLHDTLWAAFSRLSDGTSIQDMFDEVAQLAREQLGADRVVLYQLAPGTGYPLTPPLYRGETSPPEESLADESPLFDLLAKWTPHYGEAGIVFLPLGSRSERAGALFLHYRDKRAFSPLDKLSLEAFANLVAEQINRERARWRKYEAFGGVLFGVHGPLTLSADSIRRLTGRAQETLRDDPATAEAALAQAQNTARKLEMAAMLTRLSRRDELDETGLRDELRRATTKLVQLVEPNCRVHTDIPDEADDLPIAVLDALYCLAMEAVANAAFHGHAQRIDVEIELDSTAIRLGVSDNGQGFDPAAARPGPNGIFENLELAQKQFAARGCINSQPGAGATVEVVFPCLPDVVELDENELTTERTESTETNQ
jgi:putative methionine-R-sulfoxide reductase with GAF domain